MVLKIVASGLRRPGYSKLAVDLVMRPSEVHACVHRARASLLHRPKLNDRPNLAALEEFLFHGLKFAFPAERANTPVGFRRRKPPSRSDS